MDDLLGSYLWCSPQSEQFLEGTHRLDEPCEHKAELSYYTLPDRCWWSSIKDKMVSAHRIENDLEALRRRANSNGPIVLRVFQLFDDNLAGSKFSTHRAEKPAILHPQYWRMEHHYDLGNESPDSPQ